MSDNVSVAQPASGTYGEGADAARLKKQLPVGAIGNPAPPAPTPPMSTEPPMPVTPVREGRPSGPTAPSNIPSVLTAPTDRPGIPVGTPLAPSQPIAPDPQQARVVLLDQLANSPDVSDDTREWAKTVLDLLLHE